MHDGRCELGHLDDQPLRVTVLSRIRAYFEHKTMGSLGQQTEKEFAPMKIMLAFAVLIIAFGFWSITTLPMSNVVIWLLAIAGFFGMLALGLMCVEYIEWRAAHSGPTHRPSSYRWHVSL
jgi:amino acid permease